MSPPQLAGDAPVSNVVHPFEIRLRPVGRNEFHPSVFDGPNRRLGKRLYLDKPLRGNQRFHDCGTPVALTDIVRQRLHLDEKPLRIEIFDNLLTRCKSVHSLIDAAFRSDFRVLTNHGDLRKVVTLPHLKVGQVVRRCDLHGSGSELWIDGVVLDEWNFATDQRQNCTLTRETLVSLVFRIHCNRGIAQHRLGPRCCDFDELAPVFLSMDT